MYSIRALLNPLKSSPEQTQVRVYGEMCVVTKSGSLLFDSNGLQIWSILTEKMMVIAYEGGRGADLWFFVFIRPSFEFKLRPELYSHGYRHGNLVPVTCSTVWEGVSHTQGKRGDNDWKRPENEALEMSISSCICCIISRSRWKRSHILF